MVAVGDHWLVRLTDIGSIDARRSWLETYAEKLPAGAADRLAAALRRAYALPAATA